MPSLNPSSWPRTVKMVIAFATLYVVWGSTYLVIKIGLNEALPPTAFAAMRLVPAGLVMLGIARLRGKSLRMRPVDLRLAVIVGILLLVGGMYSTFIAEGTIDSGLAALIVAALPLWIAVAESIVPGMERPSARGVLGLLIGFTGLAVLIVPKMTGITGGPRELAAIGVMILGTWLWSAGSIISKKRPVRADAMVATGYEMLAAGAVLSVLATVLGEWGLLRFTATGAAALLYLILVGSAMAFTAFVWLLRHAPASKVMTYAYVNPVVAAFLGWIVLRERLDAWSLAGMVIIVAGVALTTSAPTRPARNATADAPRGA
jgi:drug/metabolite transporter (DMT)-like permease